MQWRVRPHTYGLKPAQWISSYMLLPPWLIVQYCAAIMVLINDSTFHITRKPQNLWDDHDNLCTMTCMHEVCFEERRKEY